MLKLIKIRRKKKLIKLLIGLLIGYILLKCLTSLFELPRPTLVFDLETQSFQIDLNRPYAKSALNIVSSQISSQSEDLYLRDLNEESNNQNLLKFEIRSARLGSYQLISLENWINAIEHVVNLGLNTIEIDCVWNVHETIQDQYDFKRTTYDLENFIRLVKSYKLFLIVRLDPYLPCSDYEFGGLPNWLLGDNDQKYAKNDFISLNNEYFMERYEKYLTKLSEILKPYQTYLHDGPLIAFRIQNYEINSLELKQNHLSDVYKFYSQNFYDYMKRFLYKHGIFETLITSINTCEYEKSSNNNNNNLSAAKKCDPGLNIYLSANKFDIKEFYLYNLDRKIYNIKCLGKLFI
jgi:hypothetical protein